MTVARIVFHLAALLPLSAWAAGSSALLEQVEADYAALVAAESDFRSLRERGALDTSASAEYDAYLQLLRQRLAADCRALLRNGEHSPPGVPCRDLAARSRGRTLTEAEVPPSREERAESLDAELEAGLAEFDEMLLREQQRVRAATPRTSPAGAGSAGAGGDVAGAVSDAGGSAASRDAGESAEAERGASSDERPPGAGRGAQTATQGGDRPPDLPDGSDDDVVARQLREAAENETDPELRKKLWEEYRRYKRGTR
jgi:hypothetical protein